MRVKILKGLLCFIPTIFGFIFWNFLNAEMPTHFGLLGVADRFSSKFIVVFIEPVLFFIIHVIGIFVIEKHPDWIGNRYSRKLIPFVAPIMSLVSFLIAIINSPR